MSLFIVSTPIGNLDDITFRAVKTLQSVDLICAEDTRTAKILLHRYQISKPLLSLHSYSDDDRYQEILQQLQFGKNIALISEAGTPGISDPGWKLIRSSLDRGITVIPIPGASAFLTALMASGLPMDRFTYLGFLPLKKGRKTLIQSLRDEKRTMILYESPHRILRTLEELSQALPEKTQVVIARELTKIHEEYVRGSFEIILKELRSRPSIKGEIVILLHL